MRDIAVLDECTGRDGDSRAKRAATVRRDRNLHDIDHVRVFPFRRIGFARHSRRYGQGETLVYPAGAGKRKRPGDLPGP